MRRLLFRRFDQTTRANQANRGFTLAEVMVAVVILSFIGTATIGVFSNVMRARDKAAEITGYYHQVRQAMLRMTREIQQAYISLHQDCEEKRTETLFIAKRSSGGMRLDFTSFSHVKLKADANESDQNELSYFVGQDPEDSTKTVLLRREQSRIDDEADEGGVVQVLAEDVVSLEFEFYDPKEDRWEDEWDSTSTDFKYRLPMFVAIHLKMKGLDGEDQSFTTKTRIFLKQAILIPNTGFSVCRD
ncbi:prepilin-type N-terminal cleavage/methylation domain-containing protein [Myxococcota bacterium]|nr:prepilin-type N-terminal cleavage/methylation domain-containing protein [Myxococcota bacterium]